ncbi:hypothetical protein C2G38_2200120 [Gigaspora rosea]|uniref:Uncharacterized protein n=1 Tax=Gigaspora rosea TaxID=44941 RepID=A0A397UTE1_9GLOM|nr:hypothetical protein C2G38_2200120 [Gigaspora rosea]
MYNLNGMYRVGYCYYLRIGIEINKYKVFKGRQNNPREPLRKPRNNHSWLVREINSELEVLEIHSTLMPINIKTINDNSNKSARYYPYQSSKDVNLIWIPLLLGYTIYFKLYISKDEYNQLIYKWAEFANIQLLQNIVSRKYPTLFQIYANTIKAFQKESTLNKALKHKANELSDKILNEDQPIVKGIILEQQDQILESKLDTKEQLDEIIMGAIKNAEVAENNNENMYIQFSKAVATAGLAEGLTYHALQSTLASIGVTKQYSKVSHYNYQAPMIKYLVKQTKESAQNCHGCNARQASGKFIFQETIPVERDFVLEIVVNGDLDTNKTLSNVLIVNRIYADLKHLSKNIRKALSGLRKNNSNEITPTQLELQKFQTEGLQNSHSLCWSEVC